MRILLLFHTLKKALKLHKSKLAVENLFKPIFFPPDAVGLEYLKSWQAFLHHSSNKNKCCVSDGASVLIQNNISNVKGDWRGSGEEDNCTQAWYRAIVPKVKTPLVAKPRQ